MSRFYKVLCAIILFFLIGCAQFGTPPNDEEKKAFQASDNYNSTEEQFENRIPNLQEKITARFRWYEFFDFFFGGDAHRRPDTLLPQIKPDLNQFLKASKDIKIIWFGHSTLLLNVDGVIILIDPIFSDYASPVPFFVERFQKPVLTLSELPKIDYVLISHDHYDHLDYETIKFFKDKESIFIMPLGVGGHLRGWGIEQERVIEKDWWEQVTIGDITLIATPSQHFSGRSLNRNKTLWASWIIRSNNHNIYFSGDSGYDVHFKNIGDRYGPFDLAFLENGQYNTKWREMHLLPEETIRAFNDLQAKKLFPIHWGMFVLAYHPWFEPIENVSKLAKKNNIHLVAPKLGQVVQVNDTSLTKAWWKDVPREQEADE